MKWDSLLYFNEFGGFSADGKEYQIKINAEQRTPAPWAHMMANREFGTLVTSNGGGYTWYGNSRENKITTWSNDQVSDRPSEVIFVKGEEGVYTATPVDSQIEYTVTYGFGYASFETAYEGVRQELTVFVPNDLPEKISILRFKNETLKEKYLKLYYCIEPVLGVSRETTKKHILSKRMGNAVALCNYYREHYADSITYLSSSETITKATCEKEQFQIEEGILEECFGVCQNPFAVLEVEVLLGPEAEKTVCFSLGECERNDFSSAEEELAKTKEHWRKTVEGVQVKTPVESMNIIMNGWLTYQTIVSRLYGRTAFYQCGGAFGFRDQLQDLLGILVTNPTLARKQILYSAAHQFREGDVLHWWHPERNNGIRTRYKDDMLWLPYVVYEYACVTGDSSIWEEAVPYVEGRKLGEDEDEIYEETSVSEVSESIYWHCLKAIEVSLHFGEHGLPEMGGGDWNDGMNQVCGESVWLGFFLYDILKKFSRLCEVRGDKEFSRKYEEVMGNLREALNQNAWDGRWYRRAYFPDGTALGSSQNEECKIDGISQSWAVISGAGDAEKVSIAMDSLENYLVDKENMVIKLLTPPFYQSALEPGYIKAYIPGVRENGGQYTHGAIWAIVANSILKNGDRAGEYFRMINPIEHARTRESAARYKVEPYVVAADVYANSHLAGRGGWTWYTGSSAWLYFAGLKYLLGFDKRGEKLRIAPAIPKEWEKYEITYQYKSSTYAIKVKNPNHKSAGVKSIYLDNNLVNTEEIDLVDDGKTHTIEVEI
ncbi:MAG: hypothetical protein IJ217_01110 [Clostridia bacterium]|nr:hypothetical protein [Clostridia bacterium]